MLTIKSTEENDFVSKYLYNDPLITSRAWLGMNLDSQGDPVDDTQEPTGNASHLCAPEHSHPIWNVWDNASMLLQESPSPGRTAHPWFTLTGSQGPCSLAGGVRSPWAVPS